MKLYVMRHGEYAAHDIKNSLTEKGKEAIRHLAQFLKSNHIQVARIFHSEKLRAKETAEILAPSLTGHQGGEEKQGLNPLDDIHALLPELSTWEEDTVLVGHLPFVERLIGQLLTQHDNYSLINFLPGTLVCLEKLDIDRWILNWIVRPDLLEKQTC